MNYYISDTHFGHANIMRYDNRPFHTTDEMDEELIKRWNSSVGDDDIVYVLGDFSFHKENKTLEIMDRLNGKIVLIKGNHDKISPKVARKLHGRYEYLEIKDKDRKVILCHYPIPFWNGQFRNTIHLFGHVHSSSQYDYCIKMRKELKELQDIPMRMINVGCMMSWMDYMPRTLDFILRNSNDFNTEGGEKHDERL